MFCNLILFLTIIHHNSPSHRYPPTPQKLPAIPPSPSISLKHLWQLMFKSGVAWPTVMGKTKLARQLSLHVSHAHTMSHTQKKWKLDKIREREREIDLMWIWIKNDHWEKPKKHSGQTLHLSGFIIKYLSSLIFHADARLVKQYLAGLFCDF